LFGYPSIPPIGIGLGVIAAATVVAYVLRLFSAEILRIYSGQWSENLVTTWCRLGDRRRLQSSQRTIDHYAEVERQVGSLTVAQRRQRDAATLIRRMYLPLDPTNLRATQLGNVLTSAEEYPVITYGLDGAVWWPRIAVILPPSMQDALNRTRTPMIALLNASALLVVLAVVGGGAVLAFGRTWWSFLAVWVVGLVVARLCYVAAIHCAFEYGQLRRVAFDAHRHDVLKRLHVPIPVSLAEERLLWDALNKWIYLGQLPWETNRVSTTGQLAMLNELFFNDRKVAEAPPSAKGLFARLIQR
jgi:hypothetical protein